MCEHRIKTKSLFHKDFDSLILSSNIYNFFNGPFIKRNFTISEDKGVEGEKRRTKIEKQEKKNLVNGVRIGDSNQHLFERTEFKIALLDCSFALFYFAEKELFAFFSLSHSLTLLSLSLFLSFYCFTHTDKNTNTLS